MSKIGQTGEMPVDQASTQSANRRNRGPEVSVHIQWSDEADAQALKNLIADVDHARIRRWVRASFLDSADITVRFVDTAEGRELNSMFRGKDYATNVLTFPMEWDDLPAGLGDVESPLPVFNADIVICPEVVIQEAKQQNKTPLNHLAHLVIHGCLHAQGYVHESDAQAALMEAKEIEILKRFRIPNPYLQA